MVQNHCYRSYPSTSQFDMNEEQVNGEYSVRTKSISPTKNQTTILTDEQQLIYNTSKFFVIFELLRSYNTQLVNQALYLATSMFQDHILVIQTLNNNKQCYKCQVIDMLILVFAQLKCDDVLYTTLLEFVINHIDNISPEILLSQFHSSLLFNLPICIFELPLPETSNCINNQRVIDNYVSVQRYINECDDEIRQFITYDNIYLQCIQLSQFTLQTKLLQAKDIYKVVTSQLQRRNSEFTAALLNNRKVIDQLKSWQQSEEGRYAANMYKKGIQIQLYQNKNKQQFRNKNNEVCYINPPKDVVDLFLAKKLEDEDAVNPMTTYTKASEYENLNILDSNQISIQTSSDSKQINAAEKADIENNLFYFMIPQRQNLFQLQTISSFICAVRILEKALKSQSLWKLKGRRFFFSKNHLTYLIYEAYQYVITCFFTLYIDYAFVESTLSAIFTLDVQKQQFEYAKMLTQNPNCIESLTELSASFKLRFFSDTNFLQLLCIYLQMYSKQQHLQGFNIIYRFLSNHAICETDQQFIGDFDQFLDSDILNKTVQNICTIFLTISSLNIDKKIQNQELIEFSFRPFVIEMLFSLKETSIQQLLMYDKISIIQKRMFEQISNVCDALANFKIFKQGWEFIHGVAQ